MRNLIKFLMAVALVFSFTALANEALADHNNSPYTMAVVEFDFDGNGQELLEWRQYLVTEEDCYAFGAAVADYLDSETDVRGAVLCFHSYGESLETMMQRAISDLGPNFIVPMA